MKKRRPDPGLAWAYCRVSTTKDEQELSLEEQIRWARGFAREKDVRLELFQERASAKTMTGRPICSEMLRRLEHDEDRPPCFLIATSFDRLSRDMTDTLLLARAVRQAGSKLFVRDRGEVPMESFADQAALVGQAMGGQAENEARSNRCKASWERRRREGKPTSNKSPYGLQLRGERDETEPVSGPWVLRAFQMYAKGIGTLVIAKEFQKAAPPHRVQSTRVGSDGKPIVRQRHVIWEDNRIRKLLRQRRYRGTIVPLELFDRVQELLSNKPRWRSKRAFEYPFSGAIKCAGCGRSFHGHATGGNVIRRRLADGTIRTYPKYKRTRYYGCTVCHYLIRAERVEELVLEHLRTLSISPAAMREWVGAAKDLDAHPAMIAERDSLTKTLDADLYGRRRQRVWQLAIDNDLSGQDLAKQLDSIALDETQTRDRLRSIESAIASSSSRTRSLARAKELLNTFPTLYQKASYEQKRELATAAITCLGGAVASKSGIRWLRDFGAEIPYRS
jgi:DNA invertase Pin-like site-specific DNA recombinase